MSVEVVQCIANQILSVNPFQRAKYVRHIFSYLVSVKKFHLVG